MLPFLVYLIGVMAAKYTIGHGIAGLVTTLGGKAVAAKGLAIVGSTVLHKGTVIAATVAG